MNESFSFKLVLYFILFSPALILITLGIYNWKNNNETALIQLIIGGMYLTIGIGICSKF